jgi:hypothetical protein
MIEEDAEGLILEYGVRELSDLKGVSEQVNSAEDLLVAFKEANVRMPIGYDAEPLFNYIKQFKA